MKIEEVDEFFRSVPGGELQAIDDAEERRLTLNYANALPRLDVVVWVAKVGVSNGVSVIDIGGDEVILPIYTLDGLKTLVNLLAKEGV